MGLPKRTISLEFTNKKVPEGQYICCIHNDDQERLEVMAKALKSDQEEKEKRLFPVDSMISADMLEFLRESGGDRSSAAPGMVTGSNVLPVYCPDGFFRAETRHELSQNPYCVGPGVFLAKLRERAN